MARPRTEPDDLEGLAADPAPYRLRLRAGIGAASFQGGERRIVLDEKSPYFETSERSEFVEARQLPFLEEVA